jgi:3,4-dihydroxy 2-butanone 4-phosphate synthase/GTP cyclohydrolase II
LDSVERAIADIAAGRAVVVVDDEDRENEGDLIFAAEKATPELVAFMVRYTSGYLCVPLAGDICDRLGLLPMYAVNQDKHGTAYTVTVDARQIAQRRCGCLPIRTASQTISPGPAT